MRNAVNYKLISKFYDMLEYTYFRNWEKSPRKAVQDCILNRPAKIVDFCTGTGTNAITMASKKKNVRILGVDRSLSMLTIARQKVIESGLSNVKLRYADVTQTGLRAESVDVVMMSLILHEVPEKVRTEILEEAHRILKPGGALLITEWEKPKTWLKQIFFLPMYVLEPKGFVEFLHRDLDTYIESFGFEKSQMFHCDFSKVHLLLKK